MIEINQSLEYSNLLSFRKNLTEKEFESEMMNLEKFLQEESIKVVGPKIMTTYSINQAITPNMDIEVLIPIEKKFRENNIYKFKSELRLFNCLKLTHKGNPQGFNDTVMSLQKYITEKRLSTISSLYTVNIREITDLEEADKFHTELFISINPNIL